MTGDTSAARPLTVAVTGAGRVGALHAAAVAADPAARLVAVCDPSADRCHALAARYQARPFDDMAALLKAVQPDVVSVAAPDDRHRDPVLAALEAGCHVFCEKPLATSLDDARDMVATADRCGRRLAVDFNRRYGFAYRRARDLFRQGQVGAPLQVLVHVVDGYPAAHVQTSPTAMFTTLLTHHFDLVRWLAGEVERVQVTAAHVGPAGLVDRVAISLWLAGGALGTIVAGYRKAQKRTWEVATLVGDRGSLTIDDVTRGVTWTGTDPGDERTWRPDPFGPPVSFWQTIPDHLGDFLARLREGRPPEVSGQDGLASLRIAAAAARSWQTGGPVEILHET